MTTAKPNGLPPITLSGAQVLTPKGLEHIPLTLANGILSDQAAKSVDLSGYLILPGIIDLHGDGFERHLAPRRGAQSDIGMGLAALDAELGANGITTAVLAQFFSWEGGMRGPDFAERLAHALAETQTLTDLHMQLRLEVNMIDDYARAAAMIADHHIPYVVFNDHVPHDALAKGKSPPRLTGQALKAGRSPEAHRALLQKLHDQQPLIRPALTKLATTLTQRHVRLGSHDDASAETRASFRAMGADIAEFPETRAAALAAHQAGDPIIMGAPNVLRGGSHKRNQDAAALIADGMVQALVSDYHYPAPHRAAFRLVRDGMNLADAWALVSSRPAQVLGFEDRGVLRPGKRADLAIVDAQTQAVAGTIAAGAVTYLSGALASRFVGA